jgi:hypothetical protein
MLRIPSSFGNNIWSIRLFFSFLEFWVFPKFHWGGGGRWLAWHPATSMFMVCCDSATPTLIRTRPTTWTRFLWSVYRGSTERYVSYTSYAVVAFLFHMRVAYRLSRQTGPWVTTLRSPPFVQLWNFSLFPNKDTAAAWSLHAWRVITYFQS